MRFDADKFVLKKNKKGLGIYAARPFRKGAVIHVLTGRASTPKSIYYHEADFKRGIIDPMQVGSSSYLKLDSFSVLFNHSCDPTAGVRGRSTLFALRDIRKGQEITFDYSTTIDESFWCQCGSKKCRGVIYDFFALPPRQQFHYYRAGALPSFLEKKYKKLLKGLCPCGSGKRYPNCHGK